MLGARFKAQHIIEVCKKQTFNKVLEVGAGDGSILKFLADQNFAPQSSKVRAKVRKAWIDQRARSKY